MEALQMHLSTHHLLQMLFLCPDLGRSFHSDINVQKECILVQVYQLVQVHDVCAWLPGSPQWFS